MPTPIEIEAGGSSGDAGRARQPPDWLRLFRAASEDAALQEIGRWLGRELVGAETELPAQATMALEAWRHARAELERSEARLASRTRELDLLQAIGRRAAAAQSVGELFETAVAAIHRALGVELAVAADRVEGRPRLQLFLARPYAPEYLEALSRRASGFLGREGAPELRSTAIELDGFDPARRSARPFREDDLLLFPLIHAGEPVACLIVVLAAEPQEQELRLLFGSSNQLSLHLARILAVRASAADRFRTIVDSMGQGVLLSDDGLQVSQVNRAADQLLASIGCSRDSDLRTILDRIGAPDLLERKPDPERRAVEIEVRIAGERIWNVTANRLQGPRRGTDGVVLVLGDVTEKRRLQQQLAQTERMSSLGQMISGVAHELNNPLASILGYSQLLRLQSDEGRLSDRLDLLGREADRCRKIVQNLLSFARRREPERRPLSVNQVVENVLALMGYQLRVDDIQVEHELSKEISVIHGDTHQLEQALVNLLSNARHAIREAGTPGTVTVRTRIASGSAVVLEVEDDGPGIPEAFRSRIFEPFFTTKNDGQGTGLGLALVYGVVTDHGGSIELETDRARGTKFVVTLPVGPAEPIETVVEERGPIPGGRPGRILIVDDEEPLARLMADALSGDGHETRVVLDGSEALVCLTAEPYDLIISDVKMPGMNGDQLHAEIKRLRPELAENVLLTTGDTFGDEPEEILARTGLHVLRKPFDLDDLRRRVRARLDD